LVLLRGSKVDLLIFPTMKVKWAYQIPGNHFESHFEELEN